MRTLKKALSLVLVLAMVFTLAVPALAVDKAADFKDYDKVENKEAVDVLTAIGVINGNADGTFGADAKFTRAQGATMIAYLTLGKTVADALPTSATKFSDVPANFWGAKYIQYCANEGIINGYGNGKFGPDDELTSAQWALMLLGALGYQAKYEGIGGAGWEIAATKLAMQAGVASADDMVGTMTRDTAAKMAFNTLKADLVEYQSNGTDITIGDTNINVGATKAESVTVKKDTATIAGTKDQEGTVQFAERHFPKLELKDATDVSDDLKHPSNKWMNNGKEIGTYAKEADITFVATKDYNGVVDAYKDLYDKNYSATGVDPKYLNGDGSWKGEIKAGDIVELYMTDNKITTAVATRYGIAKIADVSTSLTKAQKEEGATCKIKLDASSTYYLDTNIAGFDADTYVEGAYILYVAKSNKIVASELAESVTGEVTAIKGGKVSVDGTFYGVSMSDTPNIGDEGVFYLNKADHIMLFDGSLSKSDNYAYIYNVTVSDKPNADGVTVTTATVYYVTVDGTKVSAVAKTEMSKDKNTLFLDDGKDATQGPKLAVKSGEDWAVEGNFEPVLVAFTTNSDKQFVLAKEKDVLGYATTATVDKTHPVVGDKIATDDTTFVFVKDNGKGVYKTSVATGYKNVSIKEKSAYTVSNKDGKVLYCFVAADNGNVTTAADLAVLLSKTPTETKTADGDTIYTYDVVIKGETTTLSFKGTTISEAFDGKVIAYKMVNNYAELDDRADLLKSDKIDKAGSDYFTVGGTYYGTADAAVYTVTVEFKNEAQKDAYVSDPDSVNVQSVTVSEGATYDKDETVYYTVSNTNVANNVYVVEFVY